MKAASAAQLAVGYSFKSLESIESSLNTLRIVLVIFTWIVGFGLILEYKTPLYLIFKGLLSIARGKSNSFDRCALRKMCWHFLGALLVTAGVLGEFWVEFKQYGAEKEFSRASASERDSLNARTAQAELTARGFDLKISESDARARSAEATAKRFEAQIASAEQDAAESKKEAAAEQLERAKLEQIVAPRSLSLDAQKKIGEACRKFRNHAALVESYGMDGEGAGLAGQIIAALKSVQIVVADGRTGKMVSGGFDIGVHVRGPATEGEFVSTLGNALSQIGNLKVVINDPLPKTGAWVGGGVEGFTAGTVFVTITVGIKPLPVLAAAKELPTKSVASRKQQ